MASVILGEERLSQAVWNTERHIMHLFFCQLPFLTSLFVILFHYYCLCQEKTNELYFLIGQDFEMI